MDSLKLLAVFAHPDDESMGMGATLAKYSAQGVDTHLICASRGERGWFGSEDQNPGPDRLGQIRSVELQNAIHELGMKSLNFLDYMDGDVDQADPAEAIAKIVTHIRSIKPQVVVTFPLTAIMDTPTISPWDNLPQPPLSVPPTRPIKTQKICAAHRVSKLYYMVDGENFINLIAPFMGDMTFLVGDQLRGEFPWKEWMITTKIEMAEYCGAAWKAIQCHQSQLATLGALAEMPADSAASVLAMQGTFYRAFSLVNGGRKVEEDFFEGLR